MNHRTPYARVPGGPPTAGALALALLPSGQGSLDELGTPLHATTFVVVDLETTGGSAAADEITEVGAVKVRGGEVVGEFQTLVRPAAPIPPFIAVLTGITDAMVADAPPLAAVLPAFLEFAAGAVLVAHNAPFDIGFLRAACSRLGHPWPAATVLDTVRLARRVLTRDEAPNCKLATLSRLFRTSTEPCHRALADARATVDVLHGLLDRVGNLGVQSLEELVGYSRAVPEHVRAKRHLADGLPAAAGVYLFRDREGRALYVGTSGDLRSRVRTYFTAAEKRRRMGEMVAIAERVDHVVTATPLEAQVRELRLIDAEQPPYNRRSRRQAHPVYVKLTAERFPRLSVVRRTADDGAAYVGPFPSRPAAELAVAGLHDAARLRQCGGRLRPAPDHPGCVLLEIDRCAAPCRSGADDGYARVVATVQGWMRADAHTLLSSTSERMVRLAAQQRFEEAALARDRVAAFVQAAARFQQLSALAGLAEVCAAAPLPGRRWQVHVVRYGRLAAADVAADAHAVVPLVALLRASAEVVPAPAVPLGAASTEETTLLLRWLCEPGTRLVSSSGGWASPVRGAAGHAGWSAAVRRAQRDRTEVALSS